MNNKGDLISREALKKVLEDAYEEYDGYDPHDLRRFAERVDEEIDNAPTVEPFEPDYVGAERLKARQRGYEEGYHNGMAIGKTLNPKIKQGEWKFHTYMPHKPYCSNCEHDSQYGRLYDFCPNCGADMRKGGAEE